MQLKTSEGPYIREPQNASIIMRYLCFALIPIIIFATYKNGYIPYKEGYHSLFFAFYPLLFVLIGMLTTFFTEFFYFLLSKKDVKAELK